MQEHFSSPIVTPSDYQRSRNRSSLSGEGYIVFHNKDLVVGGKNFIFQNQKSPVLMLYDDPSRNYALQWLGLVVEPVTDLQSLYRTGSLAAQTLWYDRAYLSSLEETDEGLQRYARTNLLTLDETTTVYGIAVRRGCCWWPPPAYNIAYVPLASPLTITPDDIFTIWYKVVWRW